MKAAPFSVDDFSGGITDNYLAGDPKAAMTMDNWTITSNRKIRSRDGSVMYEATASNSRLPAGEVRVSSLINHDLDTVLYVRNARRLYYVTANTYTQAATPASYDVFDSNTSNTDWVNHGTWRGHTFAVASSFSRPVKVYNDSVAGQKFYAAGLDPFLGSTGYDSGLPSNAMVTLANDIQDQMVDHFADTAAHTGGADTAANAKITLSNLANGCTLAAMIAQITEIQNAYRTHLSDAVKPTGTRSYHSNSLGAFAGVPNLSLTQLTPPTTLLQCAQILNELKKFYNWHVASFLGHPIATVASNLVTAASLTGVDPAPTAARNIDRLVNLVNSLKTNFNAHIDSDLTHAALSNSSGSFGGDTHTFLPAAVATGTEIITCTAHGMTNGTPCYFYSSGGLPAPLVVATKYYARSVTTNTFKLSSTLEGAIIDLTTQGTGTHSVVAARDYNAYVNAAGASSDIDSVFLLAAHLIAAYRYHNHDLMQDMYEFVDIETGYGGSTSFNLKLYQGYADSFKLEVGMFVGQPVTFPENVFPHSTQLTVISGAELTTNRPHTGAGTGVADYFATYKISNRKYHQPLWDGSKEDFRLTEAFSVQEMYADPDKLLASILDLATKFNTHQADDDAHAIGDLTPIFDEAMDITVYSYLYSFLYRRQYVDSVGRTFLDRGYALEKRVWQTLPVQDAPIIFTGITSATAGTSNSPTHIDTANTFTEVYRTITNGTQFYLTGAVPYSASSSTYPDTLSDEDLQNQEPIYYSGGIVQNEAPPGAKAFHLLDGTGFYGYVKLGAITYASRLMQSIPGNPGAVPADFYTDLEGELCFISSVANRVIVATESKTYRIEGQFDSLGQGGMVAEPIHSTVGSVCPQSAVQAEEHVIFFGTDGIYATDGYKMLKLNEHLPATYKTLVSAAARRRDLQGVYDKTERRVYWSVQRSDASGDLDTILVLDLQFGLTSRSTFYTWSGGTDFRPTCLSMFDGVLHRGDTRGYVYKQSTTTLTDLVWETGGTAPSGWKTRPVTYDYVSVAADFGNAKVRKYIASMELFAKNNGYLSLQLKSINDDQGVSASRSLKVIRYRSQYTGVIREERMMPAGGLRCSYKQIQVTNATVNITNSTVLGTVTVDRTLHTVTLDVGANDWPTYARSLEIAFAFKNLGAGNVADAYTTWYPISAKTGDVLTITDATPTAPNGAALAFLIRGVTQDERAEIQSFNVNATFIGGDIQNAYKAAETGSN